MKRSEINVCLSDAKAFFTAHQFHLPSWADWSVDQWKQAPELARWCREHQMGWDITDFGSGDFAARGLLLFCIRNGRADVAGEITYAEKIMIVREDQETPFHHHAEKMEDIIVRGGGNLMIEVFSIDSEGNRLDRPVSVRTDGRQRTLAPGDPLRLLPGESITLQPGTVHRFYAETGSGTALVGEVSKVNDDLTDNYFFEAKGRFSEIEEDEAPLHALWNEVPI